MTHYTMTKRYHDHHHHHYSLFFAKGGFFGGVCFVFACFIWGGVYGAGGGGLYLVGYEEVFFFKRGFVILVFCLSI